MDGLALAILEDKRGLLIGDELRLLSPKLWEMLGLLRAQLGKVVSKKRIYTALYGDRDEMPDDKIIDVYLCQLRRALIGSGWGLRTIWGEGVVLEPAVDKKIAPAVMRLTGRHRFHRVDDHDDEPADDPRPDIPHQIASDEAIAVAFGKGRF